MPRGLSTGPKERSLKKTLITDSGMFPPFLDQFPQPCACMICSRIILNAGGLERNNQTPDKLSEAVSVAQSAFLDVFPDHRPNGKLEKSKEPDTNEQLGPKRLPHRKKSFALGIELDVNPHRILVSVGQAQTVFLPHLFPGEVEMSLLVGIVV